MLYRTLQKLSLSLVLMGLASAFAHGQQTPAPRPAQPPQPQADALRVEAARRQTPQVVTVVHRLTGMKALALLRRSGEMVVTVDDDLVTAANAVTSITAGFSIGDGQNIVARIPQAEAEVEAMTLFQPAPPPQMSWSYSTAVPSPASPRASTAQPATPPPAPQRADFTVVESGGRQFAAKFVGLDGGSGLSLLRVSGPKAPPARDADERQLAVGQFVRLFAPARAVHGGGGYTAQGTVSVQVVEIEGEIANITRTSTGQIAYLTVSAHGLSPAIVGGVALNEDGETIGIVEASDVLKARLIPAAAVRRAASRVMARQASVPRPWLGVRGEALTAVPLEKFPSIGWTEVEAAKIKEAYKGVVLTWVAPGTPAALADLRPGDVIVRVNNFEVKGPEDFSFFLNEAGGGATVNFTVFRGQMPSPAAVFAPPAPAAFPPTPPPALPAAPPPGAFAPLKPMEVSVKLSESLSPLTAMRLAESYGATVGAFDRLPQIARGLETVTLSPKAAAHLGARSGLLVVFVDPLSAAARSGLRVFDVIESLGGKPLGQASWSEAVLSSNPRQLTLGIVREHQKVEITIRQEQEEKK